VAEATATASPPIITKTAQLSFEFFEVVTISEISKLVVAAPNKQCALDPISTRAVKACSSILAPFLT